jgi:dihydrolipoamide dehydrogenase
VPSGDDVAAKLRHAATLGAGLVIAVDRGAYPGCVPTTRLVILGGGPAGNTCASVAATLGADVTLIERDVIGGAAHLWDCIPSKALIATGGELAELTRAKTMGIQAQGALDIDALKQRVKSIEQRLHDSISGLLGSQGVRMITGTAKFKGSHEIVADTEHGIEELQADYVVIATGSRPRVPDFAPVDGERVLTTRQSYPPPEIPEHMIVIGSGVTGVEFTHLFDSFGSKVTLLVSRQQVLPIKDAEVASVLEEAFLERGVALLKGARASNIERTGDTVRVSCEDGRVIDGSHTVLAVGSVPNTEGLDLDAAGVELDDNGYVVVNHNCLSNTQHIYAAGDVSGKLPLSSVAAMQGRKIAEHLMGLHNRPHRHLDYDKAASAVFTDPEIADVGLAEAEAFASGRKVRATKVPFTANAKALIKGDPRGFVKIISDPATGVVLGGSIVGRNAAELIGTVAVAVTNGLKVSDIVDSLLVHPTLSESLADAAS